VRKFLAWESVLDEKDKLDLSPHQVKQAETQRTAADSVVISRIPETYKWLLVPTQATPQSPMTWQIIPLSSGQESLAERASKKLKSQELLVVNFASSLLRMELDRVPLWRGNHVAIRQLVDDFGSYLYLPRLQSSIVLLNAIRTGLALLTWEPDGFAYAENYDEAVARYRGLHAGMQVNVTEDDSGMLVRSEIARDQINQETAPPSPAEVNVRATTATPFTGGSSPMPSPAPVAAGQAAKPRRYHGTVTLDSSRVGRDASKIADEVITHLVGIVGSTVRVTLEIEAEIPQGASDNVVRTVTENGRTLKFASNSGFEAE